MLREIISPAKQNVTLWLPEEMIGKTVEVIAFEIADEQIIPVLTKSQRLAQINDLTKDTLTDLRNFKFSRDDANNYGELLK